MKCIPTIHHIRRPIRTALAVLAVAAVPAGAVAVPAFAGPSNADNRDHRCRHVPDRLGFVA